MKFAIGYQLPDEVDSIPEIVADYPDNISEVYFALPNESSGRAPLGDGDGWSVEEAWEAMSEDLAHLAHMRIDLVLLFNSACYGAHAMSMELEQRIIDGIKKVESVAPLAAVTTTSIFVARVVKRERPQLPVRASVNMRIGSVTAMEQLADCFDGYYMQREFNRSPETIQKLRDWCDAHGKSLHMLANSGCLHDCAFQSFHDNLVAHEAEARNVPGRGVKYPAPCWEFLDDAKRWIRLLQNTWIRPEDIHNYEKWFDTVKLATRIHPRPRQIIGAYAREYYPGNILDLLEPGHTLLLRGAIIDNSRFPEDWHEHVTTCGHDCDNCDYCESVFEAAKVEMNADFMPPMPDDSECEGSCEQCPSKDCTVMPNNS
jgi:collagenase-like PrtC family protease